MSSNFFSLSPDVVLTAIDKQGFQTTGELYQLNSYENRVFNIKLEEQKDQIHKQIIAKFYRPKRWSLKALLEEHQFLFELTDDSVPVMTPMRFKDQTTVQQVLNEIYFSIFAKMPGKMPDEFLGNDLEKIGRLLAQLHNCGARKSFQHRPTLGESSHVGWMALPILKKWVTPELWNRYEESVSHILDFLDDRLPDHQFLRIHGDCHRGNILSNGQNFFFVDFDDVINGPAVQDFWMLLSGDMQESKMELELLLKGYTEFRDFDESELELIPALRGLRIFSYAAWIAQRWTDPSFPRLFPNFNSYIYWAEEVESLEKLAWNL